MSSHKTVNPATLPCPCGHTARYEQCCGRFHAGEVAPNAEDLMRSRYSAYVLALEPYLLATWHPSTRPPALNLADDHNTRWLGLEIRQTASTTQDGSEESAVVEFVARYKIEGRAHRLHEVSRFLREGGRWYYVDGDIQAAAEKTGRR